MPSAAGRFAAAIGTHACVTFPTLARAAMNSSCVDRGSTRADLTSHCWVDPGRRLIPESAPSPLLITVCAVSSLSGIPDSDTFRTCRSLCDNRDMSSVQNKGRTTGGVTGRGFRPGRSGNPGGRPQGLARATRELVGEDGKALVEEENQDAIPPRSCSPRWSCCRQPGVSVGVASASDRARSISPRACASCQPPAPIPQMTRPIAAIMMASAQAIGNARVHS